MCPKHHFLLCRRLYLFICVFFFRLACYIIYNKYHGTHSLLSICGEQVKLLQVVCFVLQTQGALVCDVEKPIFRFFHIFNYSTKQSTLPLYSKIKFHALSDIFKIFFYIYIYTLYIYIYLAKFPYYWGCFATNSCCKVISISC